MRRLLLIFLSVPALAAAQRMSHQVAASIHDALRFPAEYAAAAETVHVLAVMVQFQKDTDPSTTGDGTFVLSAGPADTTLDAPPHDVRSFRSHLLFLENYYRRVSKGKLLVRWTLLDSVVTLGAQMASYAPPFAGSNARVADLARDSWHAVDSLHLVADFRGFDCFVVFHAGAGHDVDLVSQLGFDPTPKDIPSLYFGLNGFRGFYGPAFQGIPVQGGAYLIRNTIVVPETESRLLPGVTGDVLLELGTNGLLCASLGNFLGLPDLFNTVSGASGIGRFGLMDGQAIFSFSGAFPPEPSAWEKYWLGWIQPIDTWVGEPALTLPAVALADSVYRVPISGQEYFLLENRSRDPLRTGVTVTTSLNGTTRQQTFTRDVTGFGAYDIAGLAGVVTDVTVPDWSLPGATDPDGTFYDGGLLIWHIDESVITNGLATNSVNANPAHRGVSVIEADGSQDIGQSYGLLSPGSGSEQGTPLDFWFQGNIAPLYKNLFSPSTIPDSRSYLGANTHITIGPFSARGPRMSVTVQQGDADVAPLPGFPKRLGQKLSERGLIFGPVFGSAANGPALFVSTRGPHLPQGQVSDSAFSQPGRLFAWNVSGGRIFPSGAFTGLFAQLEGSQEFTAGPAVADMNGDGAPEVVLPMMDAGARTYALAVYDTRDKAPADGLADQLFSIPMPGPVTVPPVYGDSLLLAGDAGGRVLIIGRTGGVVDSVMASRDTAGTAGISKLQQAGGFLITAVDGTVTAIVREPNGAHLGADRVLRIGHPIAGAGVTALAGQVPLTAIATSDGYLYLLDNTLAVQPGFPVNTGGTIQSPPAWADIDGDGVRDIVVASGQKLAVYNRRGVLLDGFPVTVRANEPITSSPVVGDIDGDGLPDIAVATGDGVVAAVDRHGSMLRGFPLAAGRGQQTLALFDDNPIRDFGPFSFPTGLAVASSEEGDVSAWSTGPATFVHPVRPWPLYLHDAAHSGIDAAPLGNGPPLSTSFFPKDRAYNWPNPVYNGKTFIRYYVGDNASVKVRIFDIAGDLVAELNGQGVGGLDNEIAWDVSSVQSGVYLARIEATGGSATAVQIVKIAVVK